MFYANLVVLMTFLSLSSAQADFAILCKIAGTDFKLNGRLKTINRPFHGNILFEAEGPVQVTDNQRTYVTKLSVESIAWRYPDTSFHYIQTDGKKIRCLTRSEEKI